MNMRIASTLAAGALSLAAALPAHATLTSFTAALTGSAENPPNASTATGSAVVIFDDVNSSVSVNVTFAGLSTPATAGHIHCCTPPSGSAPVALGFTNFPSLASGAYTNIFLAGYTPGNSFASLLAGTIAGESYVNIHSASYPGGEIRGFLVGAVPEPSTYALMLAGMALLAGAARRVKKTR